MALLKKGDVNLGSGGDGDPQSLALLPVASKQTYAGIFSAWRVSVQKKGANQGKTRLWIDVYTSHAKGISSYEKLEKPTLSTCSVPVTFSCTRDGYTDLIKFLMAITGKSGDIILDIKNSGEDVVIDWLNTTLNERIGSGLSFSAEHNLYEGKVRNQIDRESIVADKKIEAGYRDKIKIDVDKDGVSFLASPKPTYEDDSTQGRPSPVVQHDTMAVDVTTGEVLAGEAALDALLEDEIPF